MIPVRADADGRELIRLDRAECLWLLGTVMVGRLIFTVNALPAVRVMNFLLDGDVIVLRTAADTTAARKAAGSIVTFEADDVDEETCSGWSVTVTGRAGLVADARAIAAYSPRMAPWAPGVRDQFLAIRVEVVEGQRIIVGRSGRNGAAAQPASQPRGR